MGIRVKKVLGYGFVDVAVEDHLIVDTRFKKAWREDCLFPNGKSIDGYFDFCRAEQEKRKGRIGSLDMHLYPNTKFRDVNPELYGFLSWESEFGLPNVLVLTPLTGIEWIRNDDMIDYYEERTKGYWGCEPHVEVLDTPLYPYDGYINNETGERADNEVREWIYLFRNCTLDLQKPKLDDKKVESHQYLIDKSLEMLGCEIHWTEKWNVMIPEQIQDYCKYVEMFEDENTVFTLQPMIYTYWS